MTLVFNTILKLNDNKLFICSHPHFDTSSSKLDIHWALPATATKGFLWHQLWSPFLPSFVSCLETKIHRTSLSSFVSTEQTLHRPWDFFC